MTALHGPWSPLATGHGPDAHDMSRSAILATPACTRGVCARATDRQGLATIELARPDTASSGAVAG